jgi:hypothetical protein
MAFITTQLTSLNTNLMLAMASANAHIKPKLAFDSDSFDILVDNCSSQSITNNLTDYIEPLSDSDMKIRGFNGATTTTKVGTVAWTILDDTGQAHTIKTPTNHLKWNTGFSHHSIGHKLLTRV